MDVFISYASADREHAARLAGTLARAGYAVWWDRTIPPGRVFDEVIQEAIAAARCMLVLWSRESVQSNWVKTEAAEGAARHMLVPVLIEQVSPPIEFKRLQAADLTRWEGNPEDTRYLQLQAAVARLVSGEQRRGQAQAAQRSPAFGTPNTVRTFALGAVSALAVGAALWLGIRGGAPAVVPPPRERVVEEAPPVRAAPAVATLSGRRDLLSEEAGGRLVVASSEGWRRMVDGQVDTYGWADQGLGVFAFAHDRPARFDTFSIYIAGASGSNVRDFELFAGDEDPSGPFHSLGRFSTRNLRVMDDPWQSFSFPPVSAKYFKLQTLQSHDDSATMFINEIRLLGVPDEVAAKKD